MEVQVCWETVSEAAEVVVAPSCVDSSTMMDAFPEPEGWAMQWDGTALEQVAAQETAHASAGISG
ncbi:MAG: hypothetical protein RBT47_03000 [Anaerolineae bacterium]|jgi:hypothetical protein|nr:hypothetical protein [Anaerolineae bacterium]